LTALRTVERAAAKAAVSREKLEAELEAAIRDAHSQGEALRKIAEAAGVSHEQIRRVLAR